MKYLVKFLVNYQTIYNHVWKTGEQLVVEDWPYRASSRWKDTDDKKWLVICHGQGEFSPFLIGSDIEIISRLDN